MVPGSIWKTYCLIVPAMLLAVPALAQGLPADPALTADSIWVARSGLGHCRSVFEATGKGRVAYIGGSITASPGWRDLTYDLLKARFPKTEFDFINAGIGGTNSSFGAFRFERDVFQHGPADLLFLEFAVNDGDEPSPNNRYMRAMEGIIRHARRLNPNMDILILYFADTDKVASYKQGAVPEIIAAHETVAEHYGLPSVHLAREVARRIGAGHFAWEQFSRDSCHPNSDGHALYAECLGLVMAAAWGSDAPAAAVLPDQTLPPPLDPLNYENGRFIPLDAAKVLSGWTRNTAWDTEKKCNYSGAADVLAAETPGAALELVFEGSLIGISAISGMDAGVLEIIVDGGAPKTLDLFDNYSASFHRPVCHVLAEDLVPGPHVLRLEMKEEANEKSAGHAARILAFVAN